MRCLIVEDDFATRKLMLTYLSEHAACDVAVNGKEALEAFSAALVDNHPYDLICMDISMPEMDGYETLKAIRAVEEQCGYQLGLNSVKIIMTTMLSDAQHVQGSFKSGCEGYLLKPVTRTKLVAEMENLGLLQAH